MKICPECGIRYTRNQQFCPRDGMKLTELPLAARKTQQLYDPFIGEILDERYKIQARVGEGSSSVVYAALHVGIDRRVAVKILRSELAADGRIADAFIREAKIASKVRHPNVVDVLDFGRLPDHGAYLVMEFLDGIPLGERIAHHGALEAQTAVALVQQVCRAVAAAHQVGVVHRDLKPDNVFVVQDDTGREKVKVMDFAIAKIGGTKTTLTKTGLISGTPEYMSPEQAAGGKVDHRTDIYSTGVILYETLTGTVPFRDDSYMGTLSHHMFSERPDPAEKFPENDVPPGLGRIVVRAMAKEPEARFASMTDFGAALMHHETFHQTNVGKIRNQSPPVASRQKENIVLQSAASPNTAGGGKEPHPAATPGATTPAATAADSMPAKQGGGIRIRYATDSTNGTSRSGNQDFAAVPKQKNIRKDFRDRTRDPRRTTQKTPRLKTGPQAATVSNPRGWLTSVVWGGAALSIGLLVGLLLLKLGVFSVRRPVQAARYGNDRQKQSVSPETTPYLVLNTIPEGADVFVDGAWIGRSPLIAPVAGGQSKKAVIEVRLSGYRVERRRVSLDRAVYLELNLKRVRKTSTAKGPNAASAQQERDEKNSNRHTAGGAARRSPQTKTDMDDLKNPFRP
jgi:serine/threonine-protein kinase